MSRTVQTVVPEVVAERLSEMAFQEGRSVSNLAALILSRGVGCAGDRAGRMALKSLGEDLPGAGGYIGGDVGLTSRGW